MLGVAHAQSASDQADAAFQRGRQLMAEGKVAEACAAFDDSQKLDPAPATVMNQANCRERNGQLVTARALFLEAARQTSAMREPTWKKIHATAIDRAARLDPRLSTLRINVPSGHVVEGLEVTRDGAIVATASWNEALPVDGGTYRISVRAPNRTAWSETVTIQAEGEAKVVEVPKLAPVIRAPEPSIELAGTRPGPDAVPARPASPASADGGEGSPWTGKRKLAIGLAAVGVAALGAGTVLGLQSNRKRNEIDSLCPDLHARCDSADRANALGTSASRLAIGADVAFGLAAGAATAAVILWVTGSSVARGDTPKARSARKGEARDGRKMMTGAPDARAIAVAPVASPGQLVVSASRSW